MSNVKKPNRWYCFTINNYTECDIKQLKSLCDNVSYLCYGFEKGEKENTPHIQGYLELPNPQRFSWIKKRLPRAHIEVKKGSRTQAREYCFKEDSNPFEYGKWRADKQGMRNDLINVKRKIDEGVPEEQIAEENFVTWSRNYRALDRYRMLKFKKRCTEKKVIWLYGSTGTGKSRKAHEMYPNAYWKPPGTKWFDGYTGETEAILDDFRSGWFSWSYMLRLLDRYPLSVETKGGSVPWVPTTIVITSPFHPRDVYDTDEEVEQLLRRITEITEVEG